MSTKKIAVVLASCGVFDRAEIHEATLTLLAIDRQGAAYQCFAPDVKQAHVVNHITGKEFNKRLKLCFIRNNVFVIIYAPTQRAGEIAHKIDITVQNAIEYNEGTEHPTFIYKK